MPTSTPLSVNNQRGFSPVLIIILLAILALGIIAYFYFSESNFLSSLFPKKQTQAYSEMGIQPGQPIDDGGNILITEEVADRLRDSGAKWVRLNFRTGPYKISSPEFYAKYDIIIKRLNDRGLNVLGLMSNESLPGSQADWTANNYEHTGKSGYNAYIEEFGKKFVDLAAHYKNQIKYWEIWNEPNCYDKGDKGFYTGCSFIYPSNFAALLAHVYTQLHIYEKKVDGVQMISGGLFGHDISGPYPGPAAIDYLNQTYDMGIKNNGWDWIKSKSDSYPMDGVGYHIYIDGGGPVNKNAFSNYLDWVENVIKTRDSKNPKQIWVTEYGWSTQGLSEDLQASNLRDALNIFKTKPFVASSFWFQLQDNPAADPPLYFGLYKNGWTPKPALNVFRTFSQSLVSAGQKQDGSFVTAITNYYNSTGSQTVWGTPFNNGGGLYAHDWDGLGYVQDFNGGSIGKATIFDTGHGLMLGFWDKYMKQGEDNHKKLGFPTSDEYDFGSGKRQDFQKGHMTWDPQNQVRVFLNTPTPAPTRTPGPSPTRTPTPRPTPTPQPSATLTPDTTSVKPGQKENGKFVDSIKKYFNKNGGETKWGIPSNNGGGLYAHDWDGLGYVQDFNGGSIGKAAIFDTGHSVSQEFWKTYLEGGYINKLKFPTSEEFNYDGGTRQNFKGGFMTWKESRPEGKKVEVILN